MGHLTSFVSFDMFIYKEEGSGADLTGDYIDELRCEENSDTDLIGD